MPPEFLDLIKTSLMPVIALAGGVLVGRTRRKAELEKLYKEIEQLSQQNKSEEVNRIKIVVDELQEQVADIRAENRELKAEMRLMQGERREKDNQILELKAKVAFCEQNHSNLISKETK